MSGASRFDCYPSDYLNGVIGLRGDEIAAYTVIIMLQYDRGEAVVYDGHERELAVRAGLSRGRLKVAVDNLVKLNKLMIENGALSNARATKELEKISQKFGKNSENSKLGGEATKRKYAQARDRKNENHNKFNGSLQPNGQPDGQPDGQPVARPNGQPKIGPIPSPSPSPSPKEKETIKEKDFQRLRQAYPKRPGDAPRPARKALDKAIREGTDIEKIILGAEAYAKTRIGQDPQYTKTLAAWLNAGMWEADWNLPLGQPPPRSTKGIDQVTGKPWMKPP